jgi:hypothetical protein
MTSAGAIHLGVRSIYNNPPEDAARGSQPVPRRYLTTREAAIYCAFKTTGAIRKAVMEKRLVPAGRRGGTGTLMFRVEDLDAFLEGRKPGCLPCGRPDAAPGGAPDVEVEADVQHVGGTPAKQAGRMEKEGRGILGEGSSCGAYSGTTWPLIPV